MGLHLFTAADDLALNFEMFAPPDWQSSKQWKTNPFCHQARDAKNVATWPTPLR